MSKYFEDMEQELLKGLDESWKSAVKGLAMATAAATATPSNAADKYSVDPEHVAATGDTRPSKAALAAKAKPVEVAKAKPKRKPLKLDYLER